MIGTCSFVNRDALFCLMAIGMPRMADVRRHIASIFLAEELIDFYPKVSMEQGLKKTVEWYKAFSEF